MGHYYSEVADQYEAMKYRGKDADQSAGEKRDDCERVVRRLRRPHYQIPS